MPLIYPLQTASAMPLTLPAVLEKKFRRVEARNHRFTRPESAALERAVVCHDFARSVQACIHASDSGIRSRPFNLQTSSSTAKLERDISAFFMPTTAIFMVGRRSPGVIPSLGRGQRSEESLSSSIAPAQAPLAAQ